MNEEARVAFIQSQVVCMAAEMEGMKAENADRVFFGQAQAYLEGDFDALAGKFGLGHNAVVAFLTGN